MPDLSAMLEKTLRILPEIYFRKVVGNGPETPSSGNLTSCPDLLLTQNPSDLAPSLGSNVIGHENSMVTGIHPAGSSQVVARLKNSGASKGFQEIHLFSAPAATFLSPEEWSLEGHTGKLKVPAGNLPALSSAVSLPSPVDPEGVAKALLAVAKSPQTTPELPPGGEYFRWPAYRKFLRRRSVGCRNVYLVETDLLPGELEIPFFLSGFPNTAARYDLEVHSQLPAGVPFQLVMPDDLAFKLYQKSTWLGPIQVGGPIPPYEPCSCFRNIYLPQGARHLIQLKILNKKNLRTGHSIFIRQLYRGEEIGRITWYFKAPFHP